MLNPATKYQEILGFGGAFTDATCYTFNQLAAPAREQLFHEMFHPSEMGSQRSPHLHRRERLLHKSLQLR